jgi:polyferredoxin
MKTRLQRQRWITQTAFFLLFVLAPVFDLFRYDLEAGHFWLFGQPWTLGLEAFQRGEISGSEAALRLLLRGFVPLALLAGAFIYTAWRWGRLYCGWLCPHYSVLETINRLMMRAIGKPSLWEKKPLPERLPDGSTLRPSRWYWLPTAAAIIGFSFIWAVVLLTYLLPPAEIYANLLHGELTRNQFIFITAATIIFSVEFTFARHFFCRYGCAVGFFQSLAWMANRKAMVVAFDRDRASLCKACNNACDNACPMRLKPRDKKRRMFACTQCGECISACTVQQQGDPAQSLIVWVQDLQALQQSEPPVGIPLKRHPES